MTAVSSVVRDDSGRVVSAMGDRLQALTGTTLLVTGAAGFLCSYFLDVMAALNQACQGNPCRVLALDNFKTGLPDRVQHLKGDANFRFIQHDVRQPFEPDERVDWIVHGASIASPTLYRRFPLETIETNVHGTRHMLELTRRGSVRSLLYLSSSEVYGDPEAGAIPTREDYPGRVSCTGPRACYDESKRLGETLCATFYRLYQTPVKIVRPFNIYGPGQRLDDGRVIPDLLRAVLRHRPLVLYSDGKAMRAFCYIRDFIRGALYVLLTGANGEAYNVGNDGEVSIGTLAECMAEVAGAPRPCVEYHMSADPDYLMHNPQRRCPDLSKLRALAPYRPEVSLAEGLARTLKSYRELAEQEMMSG